MSKASWAGAFITVHQISYEAPLLFCLFQAYFADKNIDELEAHAKREVEGLTEDDWQNFIAYVAGFYGNLSNYHSFGAMKFVPELTSEKFWGILNSNPKAGQHGTVLNHALTTMSADIDREVFLYDSPYQQINFPSQGGVSAYMSRNMSMEDLALTKEFLRSPECLAKGLDILNTRVFKKSDDVFMITVGSISEENNCTMTF